MRKSKVNNQNMFMKIITVPIRALSRAKNCYVGSVTDMGGRLTYGGTTGGFSGNFAKGLPKSYSARTTSSRLSESDDDYSELIRAATARNYEERIDVNMIMQEHMKRSATTTTMRSDMGSKIGSYNRAVLPKCGTVAMGRIDEDAPEDFDEGAAGVKGELYPRSRSYAVGKRSAFAF